MEPSYLDQATAKTFAAMAETGCDIETVEWFFDLTGVELPPALRRRTFGPIVYHLQGGDWIDRDFRKEWAPRVYAERILLLAGGPHLVSQAEIVMVMQNAVMDAPPPRDLGEIFVWAGAGAVKRARGTETHLEIASDRDVLQSGGRLHAEYLELCRAIAYKVDRCSMERQRQAKRDAKAKLTEAAAPDAEIARHVRCIKEWIDLSEVEPEAELPTSEPVPLDFVGRLTAAE